VTSAYDPQRSEPWSTPPTTADDRTWAMVSHLASFLAAWIALGLLCPILVLILKGSRPFVRQHAYESLNFQLNALTIAALFFVVGVLTLGIGFIVGIPFVIAYLIWYAILVVSASVKASNGEPYRYPAIIRFLHP
jgi:uncharacterized Tic20 family protein